MEAIFIVIAIAAGSIFGAISIWIRKREYERYLKRLEGGKEKWMGKK